MNIINKLKNIFFAKKKSNVFVQDNNKYDDHLYDYSNYTDEELMRISNQIYENIQNIIDPTYEDIDNILIAANYFLKNDKVSYEHIILKSPHKFMLAYANNSERTPKVIHYVRSFNVDLANKILEYTNDVHKNTWMERDVM